MPVFLRRLLAVIAAGALVMPASTPPPARALDTMTLAPVADAQVNEGRPANNYGTTTTLRVRDASNDYRSFLQFEVSGLAGAPASATLRLYIVDASPVGGTLSQADSGWTEDGVAWDSAPAIGAPIGVLGSVSSDTWVEVDVTAAVTGNGTVSFAIHSGNGNSVLYSSREGVQPPQLVLETATTPPPPPPAPVASFTATPTSGTAPLAVAFTDTSTNSPTSWAWDFDNDGTTDSTAQHPSFTYANAGTYSVRLTATNAGGSHSVTRTDLVTVSTPPPPPPAPVASFDATPTSGTAPLTVTFTDTSTNSPTSWAWDFDLDGTVDSVAQHPTHTYANPGTFSVSLRVGNDGGSHTLARSNLISVSAPPPPPAPVASFTATPTSGTAPLAVAFTDTSTNTPTSWAWDFDNDGTTDSTAQHPSFTYANAGTYSVRLTATNAGGSHSVTRTDLVTVSTPPPPPPGGIITLAPIGDAYVNESRPTNNYGTATTLRVRLATDRYASLVRFDVTGLSGAPTAATLRLFVVDDSPSGGRVGTTATTWAESTVTWGNHPPIGATLAELGPAVTGAWMEVDVTAAITGNGPVAFYLEGISGNSVLYSSREGAQPPQLILQTGSTPPPPGPVAAFTANPTSGTAPLTVAFTDTSTNTPTTWAWDFDGDGVVDASTQHPSFTYFAAGTYDVTLTVGNAGGTDSETRSDLITVSAAPPPPPGSAVLVGAGDIARCNSTNDEATAELINNIPGTVFTAGDNVYEVGSAAEFADCYDPSWGQFKSRTRPTAGNHDYDTPGATGYYGYFGAAAGDPSKGYYSYDVGAWHIVALNSECGIVSCSATSEQANWLRADLAANPSQCTMAIFHRPLFSSSTTTGYSSVRPLWQILYDEDADVVVNGHAHIYERFAPQTPQGTFDAVRGIRQFTVGTGGASLAGIASVQPNSQVRSNTSHGVVKFTLYATGFDWQFVPIPGDTLSDSGSQSCH